VTNRTIVFPEPGEVRIEDRPMPERDADEVLVETTASLVSTGTELTILSGDFPDGSSWDEYGQYPLVPGYCNVGTVVEAGADAAVETGTLVATRGPHQQYVTSSDPTPVPEGVDAATASLFALSAVAMNGVRRGEVTWGDAVAVYGLGLLGQLTVRWCRFAGARPVVACDLTPERLSYLPDDRTGIVAANPAETDVPSTVTGDNRGRLADVVVEATGNPDALPGEFDALRRQGRMVVLSSPRGETTLDFHDRCNAPGYEIVGAHERTHPPEATPRTPWSERRHRELFFDCLERDELAVGSLVSHRVPSESAPETYRDLLADRTDAMGVVIDWMS
jgi:2-desacetyl-2-hydroxyethyl bacteriochlorophyllide A dehydrogenase